MKALLGLEWTNSHQCTSWPFCPLDALHFFIRRWMGFMTVHFFLLLTIVLFFFGSWSFFPRPDLTHSYHAHFSTFISIAPTLVPYLLSPNIVTLITSYPIDLTTVLTTYPTNLATLLITYPTLNAIPAFWAISKVRMWGSSFFIQKSYPKYLHFGPFRKYACEV